MVDRYSRNRAQSFSNRCKSFWGKHKVVAALLFAALLIRSVYLVEMVKSPCYQQHLWEQSDMNFFHLWAQQIASGDWLMEEPHHPYHEWHDWVANLYFRSQKRQEPTFENEHLPIAVDLNKKLALWDRWYGGSRYHQEPFYPYLLAMIYRLFGDRVIWVFILQLFAGIISIVLIHHITMRFFGGCVASIAGILAVLCAPLLFFETVLLRTTLITFSGLLLVYLSLGAIKSSSLLLWGRLGLIFGFSILLKSTFLLFLSGIVLWVFWVYRHSMRKGITYALALIAGVAIALFPLMVRNVAVGAPPLGLSSVNAVTFLCANARDTDPHGFYVSQYVAPIMEKTNGAFLPTVIETLKTQTFSSYAMLLWHKIKLMWHWYEIPNNTNFYYYRLHSHTLRMLPITFMIISSLCIVGIGLALWQRRRCVPLYLLLALHVASILSVYVSARFRVPLLAASLPFAALTVGRIIEDLQMRKVRKNLMLSIPLILISFWTMRPLPDEVSLIRTSDYHAPYLFHYQPRLLAARAAGDIPEQSDILKEVIRSKPESVSRWSLSFPPRNRMDQNTALLFSQFYRIYANLLIQTGRHDAARSIVQRGKELEMLSKIHLKPAASKK